ncbi:hypothetical protein Q5H92_13140 [Hymenobacter sp. M29]|uniref:DUF4131 domain-containing protein n=1 Tax=Hymenobacter mellowenesis TaxID=3063995 RepID=A0ABT9AE86_9BACT|nr:hypothetical protein [Hymenobacter sp. M29]MDO7847311.1 hypothetical protein [Hymenobacter sp. M29]
MLKDAPFVPVVLFCFGVVAPYVQTLLVPHTLSAMPLVTDFVALLVLTGAAVALAVAAKQRGYPGRGLLYPAVAVLAIVGYFRSQDALQHGGEYLDFRSRKTRIEAHVAALQTSPTARAAALAATVTVRYRGYPGLSEGVAGYDVLPSRIILCTTGGANSERYWGYAYSPAGEQPSREEEATLGGAFFQWRHLEGPWYAWARSDQ